MFICAAPNCAQRMRTQATCSNILSVSIICLSVCPSSCSQEFWYFCICIDFQCDILSSRCIYPNTRVQFSLYVCVSVCLSICSSASIFGNHLRGPLLCAAHSASGHGSNPLSSIIICPYVHASIFPVICGPCEIFVFVLISSVGVQRCDAFIPQTGVPEDPSLVQSILYVCVSVQLSLFLFRDQSAWPITVCIACRRRPPSKVPLVSV